MKGLLTLLLIAICTVSIAQTKIEVDKSPMDMSYCPMDYPVLKMNGKVKDVPVARVIYSRPLKSGRQIFGGINKYGEVWRLGANEATEIEFFKQVKIAGKIVLKGRYTLFCIPYEDKWTIIINKDTFEWGSFTYDAKKDLLRTDVQLDKTAETVEPLTIYFEENKKDIKLIITWDNIRAALPIQVM